MHRSGTSLAARLLERGGLLIGRRKDPNNEAHLFLDINRWLLTQAGATWDQPEPAAQLAEHPVARQLAERQVRFMLRSPKAAGFMGLRRWLKDRTPENLTVPWGWKDPRNTFTLGLWLRLMPDAKVIHVHRHGVDVAASLKARADEHLARMQRLVPRLRWLFVCSPTAFGLGNTMRCATLVGGLQLWGQYMRQAKGWMDRLGERGLTVCYEDLLTDPLTHLDRMFQFAGIKEQSASRLKEIAGGIRTDRALAYRKDAELAAFADSVTGQLAEQGY